MRLIQLALPVIIVGIACHHQPETAVTPVPDTLALAERARADSLARDAAERAREDSTRLAAQRAADSLAAAQRVASQMKDLLGTRIHFDFDRSLIRLSDAELLDQKIAVLRANPDVRIQIVGNCDERGSDEYNLALGNRRAITARSYLVKHGIDPSRIETLSYGEEKPIDPRHNEAAWALNRNDGFEILTPSLVLRMP